MQSATLRRCLTGCWSRGSDFFLEVVDGVFAGVFEKSGAQNVVFLLVSLWWIAGESWCVGWCFFRLEKMPLSSSLFFAGRRQVG
jgi:hypothetical protein